MNDIELNTLAQIEQFLSSSTQLTFEATSRAESYLWVTNTLKKFAYCGMCKKDKGLIRDYLQRMTGYSRSQITRLIAQYQKSGKVVVKQRSPRNKFSLIYTHEDTWLLAETDQVHQTLSGPTTKKLCERAFHLFGDKRYARLAFISVSHLYNLRQTETYQRKRRHFNKTKATQVSIGERRKPTPEGRPGFIRIDTMHQGDMDKIKGVYHINAVDEVTQMEVVCAVEKISEAYLIPVLEQIIDTFPFKVLGLHADNGSEYINQHVAKLLQKLFIELTKSRPRHSNDNGLVESKNGSVVRKHFGYIHIQQRFAPQINEFYNQHFNDYINFHRPCYFPVTSINSKGKQTKLYPYEAIMTPYEKFKSIENAEQYLKENETFERLDKLAYSLTDHESAQKMQEAKKTLFEKITKEQIADTISTED